MIYRKSGKLLSYIIFIVIQIKILNEIIYFLILYIDGDVFGYNFILVSSLWRWEDYWPKHVGEHIIYKNT